MSLLMRMRQIKDLSPSERHIVEYIFEHLQDVSGMGIVELGERTFTSTTTVKRLCRKLGIESFTDFRIRLSSEIADYARLNILQGAQEPVGRYDSVTDIITKVSNQNAKSLIDTSCLNEPGVITGVIGEMARAKRIDFYGVGPSNVVAVDAQIKCMRLGIPTSAFDNRVSMLTNARAFTDGALGFLISYTGETDDILAVAEELQLTEVTAVSMTSSRDNPLTTLCRYNLFVDASESWNRLGGMASRISTLNMIDILFTALMNTNYEKYTDLAGRTLVPNKAVKTQN